MVKGEDAVTRKRNRANRKKNKRKESSSVSNRVAAIIAAKKRRKSGKRRICQGMCFSLPTPEDPFNERHGKMDFKSKETKKPVPSKVDRRRAIMKDSVASRKGIPGRNNANADCQDKEMPMLNNLRNEEKISLTSIDNVGQKNVEAGQEKVQLIGKTIVDSCALHGQAFEPSACSSKFLILCLNAIENALLRGEFSSTECDTDKPLLANKWGLKFWKCYSAGKDILDTSGACSTVEQIAWMTSAAADTLARKEKEGLSLTNPFLLFLVPSQEKAAKVRAVCKPLKTLGIHTVSLHPGAPLDHQIYGLKRCEPEFLVSTPERLMELVSLKAIDISGVSLLVVDGLEMLIKGGYVDTIKSIRQSISVNPLTVVISDSLSSDASHLLVENLLGKLICRLPFNDSVTSQSAGIIQSVHVCASEEEKLSKGVQILDEACSDQLGLQFSKVLFMVGKDCNFQKLAAAIESKGYFVTANSDFSKVENRKSRPAVFILDVEHIDTNDLGEFEVVIVSDFVQSIDNYVEILTRMARFTVKGVLHSFLTTEDTMLMGPLIEILEKCGQAVPEPLRNLWHSTRLSEH